jgi:hypothetical protein
MLRCRRSYRTPGTPAPELLLHSFIYQAGEGVRAVVLVPTGVPGDYKIELLNPDYLVVMRNMLPVFDPQEEERK